LVISALANLNIKNWKLYGSGVAQLVVHLLTVPRVSGSNLGTHYKSVEFEQSLLNGSYGASFM
jgi:hypothetical protein